MTIQEMIDELEDFKNDYGPDVVVNLGVQSNYPFENHVSGFTVDEGFDEDSDDPDQDCNEGEHLRIIILEGSQIRYGKKSWWS